MANIHTTTFRWCWAGQPVRVRNGTFSPRRSLRDPRRHRRTRQPSGPHHRVVVATSRGGPSEVVAAHSFIAHPATWILRHSVHPAICAFGDPAVRQFVNRVYFRTGGRFAALGVTTLSSPFLMHLTECRRVSVKVEYRLPWEQAPYEKQYSALYKLFQQERAVLFGHCSQLKVIANVKGLGVYVRWKDERLSPSISR